MKIAHNLIAENACMNSVGNNKRLAKTTEKLASGYRINRAADDAAGLAISNKMKAQIRGLEQAAENAEDAISLIKTAEGGMQEIHSMLHRIREIAVQSSNDTNTEEDRGKLDQEIGQLLQEIDRTGNQTEYNTMKLLNGKLGAAEGVNIKSVEILSDSFISSLTVDFDMSSCKNGLVFIIDGLEFEFSDNAALPNQIQIGDTPEETANNLVSTVYDPIYDKYNAMGIWTDTNCSKISDGIFSLDLTAYLAEVTFTFDFRDVKSEGAIVFQVGANSGQEVRLSIGDVRTEALGIAGASVADYDKAQNTITAADRAINRLSKERGVLGAMQNRLEHTVSRLESASENLTNSESKISDTDMAKEMVSYSKSQILSQASQSVLAQANKLPEMVLSLLN